MDFVYHLNRWTNPVIIFVILLLIFSCGMIANFLSEEEHKTLIIAQTISAEACSEGPHAMMGVASTIKNRMEQRGLTAYEVVTEKNQYYGLTNPNREKIFENPNCSEPALKLAQHVSDIPDIVDGAIYFKTVDEPLKSWHKIKTAQIGVVEFYK